MSAEDKTNSTLQRRKPSDSDPLPNKKLNQDLQNLVDEEESLFDQVCDGTCVCNPVEEMNTSHLSP